MNKLCTKMWSVLLVIMLTLTTLFIAVVPASANTVNFTTPLMGRDYELMGWEGYKNDNEQNYYVTVTWYEAPYLVYCYFGARRSDNTSLTTSNGIRWDYNKGIGSFRQSYFTSAGAAKNVYFLLRVKTAADNAYLMYTEGRWTP